MSIVKSFSFADPNANIRGDMFYIQHDSKNFTVIDCFLKDEGEVNGRKAEIINEIRSNSEGTICRFISTHPDNDHILGIEDLDKQWPIINFYAVENSRPRQDDNPSLDKYMELKKVRNFAIKRGIKRKWLNCNSDENGSSNIDFLWPVTNNIKFMKELEKVAKGESPNNISCAFTYTAPNGAVYMWMGDMESDMQEEFYNTCGDNLPRVDVLFHPHHGRNSGALPDALLKKLKPRIIVIGNAPSNQLNYMNSYDTITQNTAGDIEFVNEGDCIHIYTSKGYCKDFSHISKEKLLLWKQLTTSRDYRFYGWNYFGSISSSRLN